MDFVRTSGIPHCIIIHRDIGRWLPWYATDMNFPMFWGADKNKNRMWNIYIDIYIPRETPKACWDEECYSQHDAKNHTCTTYSFWARDH